MTKYNQVSASFFTAICYLSFNNISCPKKLIINYKRSEQKRP